MRKMLLMVLFFFIIIDIFSTNQEFVISINDCDNKTYKDIFLKLANDSLKDKTVLLEKDYKKSLNSKLNSCSDENCYKNSLEKLKKLYLISFTCKKSSYKDEIKNYIDLAIFKIEDGTSESTFISINKEISQKKIDSMRNFLKNTSILVPKKIKKRKVKLKPKPDWVKKKADLWFKDGSLYVKSFSDDLGDEAMTMSQASSEAKVKIGELVMLEIKHEKTISGKGKAKDSSSSSSSSISFKAKIYGVVMVDNWTDPKTFQIHTLNKISLPIFRSILVKNGVFTQTQIDKFSDKELTSMFVN